MPLCQSKVCGAEITFLERPKTQGGKRKFAVVDAKPEKRWVEVDGHALFLPTYVDHHATCKDVGAFRKSKAAVPDPSASAEDLSR